MDHRVDGGGLERVSADKERVKGKDLAETLIFHMAAGHLPDRPVRAESDQVGSDTEHVGKMGERLVGQFEEGALENGMGLADKSAVALKIVGSEPPNLPLHFCLVSGIFEGNAIVPDDPVKGFAGDNPDIVGGFFSV